MNFTKMHGAGNDFVLVEANDVQRDWPKLAAVICDRHFGVGADSLLAVLPSDIADFQMRVFDIDGSEAETCGNGIRCLAKYVLDKGLINTKTNQISVETMSGVRKVRLYKKRDKLVGIQASMGKPQFKAEEIPVIIKENEKNIVNIKSMISYPVTVDGTDMLLNLVSMGNPHAVYFTEQPVSGFPLSQLGPKVEKLPVFPARTNFQVVNVINREHIEARVWERGAGETLACGSGACAITVAAQLHDYVGSKVDIKLPGGTLGVEWDGVGEVFLSGPAETVFTGEWSDEVLLK